MNRRENTHFLKTVERLLEIMVKKRAATFKGGLPGGQVIEITIDLNKIKDGEIQKNSQNAVYIEGNVEKTIENTTKKLLTQEGDGEEDDLLYYSSEPYNLKKNDNS